MKYISLISAVISLLPYMLVPVFFHEFELVIRESGWT